MERRYTLFKRRFFTIGSMLVHEVMNRDVYTVQMGTPWRIVVEELTRRRLSGAPVVDSEGKVVGVVSEKDLFRAIYPSYEEWYRHPERHDFSVMEGETTRAEQKLVETIMSTKVTSVTSDTPVLKVGSLMVATGIHRVPVVDAGELVGVVSRHEIFSAILSRYYNITPTGEQASHDQVPAVRV
jgi:CBS domain-containing protein